MAMQVKQTDSPADSGFSPLRALWTSSVLGGLAQSLAGSAGSLVAGHITGSDLLAGLPQGMLVVGAAASAPVISSLARSWGRRRALALGAASAAWGCLLLLCGAATGRLSLILLGSTFLGAGNTAVMLGRYAAADLVPTPARARAMASVLTATTIGAVAGPNLLGPTGALAASLGLPDLSGAYLVAGAAYIVVIGVLAFGGQARSFPTAGPAEAGSAAKPAQALSIMVLANLVMVGAMTMAPLQLHHHGAGLTGIGLIIGLHIGAMFAPSPVSGHVIERAGPLSAVAMAGGVLVVATVVGAAGARDVDVMTVAVILLGMGWNLAVLAGSALLTEGAGLSERLRRESWGEISLGVGAAVGGVGSGLAMAAGGYAWLSLIAAGCAVVLTAQALRARATAAGGAGAS